MNLDKARILVTGGSSGLGKAMAAALIAKGAQVAITGRDPEKLKRVAQELGATPLEGRMDRESELMHVFAQLDALWGGLDVLINKKDAAYPLPILPDGRFLAYKRVTDDFLDFYSRTVKYFFVLSFEYYIAKMISVFSFVL